MPTLCHNLRYLHVKKFTQLSEQLLQHWCDGLLAHQITEYKSPGLYGGIISPAYARIEGRCGDAVYPLIHMASKSKEQKYLDAAIRVFDWSENNVFLPDGATVNDVSVSDWRGITISSAVCLGEALYRYGDLLDAKTKERWTQRLRLQAEWMHRTITINFANINYPSCASYALVLMGRIFDEPRYTQHGQELGRQVVPYFTQKDRLLYGEGKPRNAQSPKGCYAMDIGYTVEESMPGLALYGLMEKDEEVLGPLVESMIAQMEFLLPDGAWDNSMGTRNYKWTYWGTRNAEGCQPAYALLADRHPQFLEVAHRSAELLERCTHDGILYGGPHTAQRGELASVHHTFCHAKAFATVLDVGIPNIPNAVNTVPRDAQPSIVEMSDMQTWFVANGPWRATVTGYDKEAFQNTHASGGAMSVLYHQKLGTVCVASTNEYVLIEPTNMQMDKDPNSIPLTPRVEMEVNGIKYRNICDLAATVKSSQKNGTYVFETRSQLVDRDRKMPDGINTSCAVDYYFSDSDVKIEIRKQPDSTLNDFSFILPIIATQSEAFECVSPREYLIIKADGKLKITASEDIALMPTTKAQRVFHFVPGMEAIPFVVRSGGAVSITISAVS
jgi:hypothetical protein